uniref:Serpin B6 n=1 Tax=Pseudonaja textilis TaxID=8673 RepID=A0A670ZCK3_PSETE
MLENMGSRFEANTKFALNFFKELSANDPSDNVVCSPFTISSSLLMVLLGARNNTEAQILKVYQDTFYQKGKKRVGCVPTLTKSILVFITASVVEMSLFLKSFIESTEKFYNAGLEKLNFKQASEDSRRHINAWVEEKTSGKIQDLLGPGIIDSHTKLVSVNAIYFKGNWADKFNKDLTSEKPFWINKNESKTVQMMFKKAKYNMAHISAYQTSVLEIPFGDNELSMIILLPDEIADNSTGLEKREITYEKLMDWINPEKMFPREIELSFPKFKLEEKYDLKPVLRSMGMTDAFDEGKADFSRMSTNKDLALSEVIHKAFLEVNEEGTEAAAATGVIRVFKSAQPPLKFTADHPFLYFITERSTNSIVVIGRYSSP